MKTEQSLRKKAHLVHHRIADFVLHKMDRDALPQRLSSLVRKYEEMMRQADNRIDQ